MKEIYELTSEYYDILHSFRNEDIGYYKDLATKAGSPVLELACGTGRILIPIAESGIDITGIDKSEKMLKVLRKKIKKIKNADVLRKDMTNFDLKKKFKMIFLPFSSFYIINKKKDQESCLKCAFEHLDKKGIFVLDGFQMDPGFPQNVLVHDMTMKIKNGFISRFSTNVRDDEKQLIDVKLIYDITKNGKLERRYEEFKIRYVMPKEMRIMLENAGFRKIKIYQGYDNSKFTKDSDTMVFIAEKS